MENFDLEVERTKAAFMFKEWLPAFIDKKNSIRNSLEKAKQEEILAQIEADIDKKTYYRIVYDLLAEANRVALMIGNKKLRDSVLKALNVAGFESEDVTHTLNLQLLRVNDFNDLSKKK